MQTISKDLLTQPKCSNSVLLINLTYFNIHIYNLTEDGQSLAKAMMKFSKKWLVSAPRIDKPSDTTTEREIKNVILQMLQLEPANRITAVDCFEKLTEVKANMT